MKKKVFLFAEENVALNYGIGTYLQNLTTSMNEDYSIYVIKLFTHDKCIIQKTIDNVIHINFPFPFNTNLYEYRYLKRIVYFIRQQIEGNESILFHFNSQLEGFFHLLKEHFKFAKFIYTIHYLSWRVFPNFQNIGYTDLCLSDISNTKIIEKIKAVGNYIKLFDSVITLSLSTFDIVTKYYLINSSKVHYIPNCIHDIYSENLITGKERIKQEFGLDKDEKICLFVGRIIPNKGVVELIRAFKRVLLNEKKCQLIIVGDGCYDLCLSEISPLFSKITFTGFIDRGTIIKLYHISDIGVLPSYFEECNYAVLEMMSSKLPVIITRVPGLMDFAEDNNDLSIPANDINSLTDKMLQLLSNDSLRNDYSKLSRTIYEKRYRMEIFKKNMSAIYQ